MYKPDWLSEMGICPPDNPNQSVDCTLWVGRYRLTENTVLTGCTGGRAYIKQVCSATKCKWSGYYGQQPAAITALGAQHWFQSEKSGSEDCVP